MYKPVIPTVGMYSKNSPFVQMAGITHQAPTLAGDSGVTFRDVMFNTLDSLNKTAKEPDALMREAMTTGSVDIHDVMISNAKAELAVNITTQVVTKTVQAYDRILQIQL